MLFGVSCHQSIIWGKLLLQYCLGWVAITVLFGVSCHHIKITVWGELPSEHHLGWVSITVLFGVSCHHILFGMSCHQSIIWGELLLQYCLGCVAIAVLFCNTVLFGASGDSTLLCGASTITILFCNTELFGASGKCHQNTVLQYSTFGGKWQAPSQSTVWVHHYLGKVPSQYCLGMGQLAVYYCLGWVLWKLFWVSDITLLFRVVVKIMPRIWRRRQASHTHTPLAAAVKGGWSRCQAMPQADDIPACCFQGVPLGWWTGQRTAEEAASPGHHRQGCSVCPDCRSLPWPGPWTILSLVWKQVHPLCKERQKVEGKCSLWSFLSDRFGLRVE